MVDVSIHNTTANPPQVRAEHSGSSSWLSIRQGESEITIYGRPDHVEAFRMAADVLNDAFAKAQTPADPAPAATPDEEAATPEQRAGWTDLPF